MLELKNIKINFNNHSIFNNLSLNANNGDFIIIVGHNGSGKTTLLNTITGKTISTSGNIFLNQKNITKLNKQHRAQFTSMLFQDPKQNTATSLTVKQNFALALLKNHTATLCNSFKKLQKTPKITEQFKNIFHKSLIDRSMKNLSGGQRQMIAFLMATIITPKILLLDEPTAALDPQSSKKMIQLINQHAQKKLSIILMVTHNLEQAANFGNKLWVIKNKIIVEIDKIKQNINTEKIKNILDN